MITHNLVQGSDAWCQFRLEHFGASEAAAMLGLSTKVKRTELLHMKHTGLAREFSDWVQKNILDHGHEVEALARPIVEAIIGDDLYPVTCSDGRYSASCDGLTMSEKIAFEHKQWNAVLAACVEAGELPEEFMPQCQQILMVTGAQHVVFTVSDGTEEKMVYMHVIPDLTWFERIRAGWAQFEKDLADYVPAVVEAKPLGHTPETLPALRLEVSGMVKASNLAEFKEHALAVFAGINRELTTDQQFADAEKTVRWCADVESRLAAAKEHALSQTESIDQLFKTIDDISAEARAVRLELDKLVTRRKGELRDGIVVGAKTLYDSHIASLKVETDGFWLTVTTPDFAGAIKGKRSIESMRDAVNTALANAKIDADASAKKIRANLAYIKDNAAGFEFLFSDKAALIDKKPDDLELVVASRIAAHRKAEADKLEAERARIQAEEQTKAEAKVRAEQDAERASQLEADRQAALVVPAKVIEVIQEAVDRTPIQSASTVVAMAPRQAAATAAPPSLRLGQIGERLGFALTADFLRSIGFEPAGRDKSAILYHENSFVLMCAALIQHIEQVQSKQAA